MWIINLGFLLAASATNKVKRRIMFQGQPMIYLLDAQARSLEIFSEHISVFQGKKDWFFFNKTTYRVVC